MGETLYKYCDQNGVKMLETFQIKVTRPNEFNDPFEVSPRFVDDFAEGDAARFFDDRALVERELARRGAPRNVIEGFGFLADHRRDGKDRGLIASAFASLLAQMAKENVAGTQKDWSSDIGILCLSRVPDNVLMWSHYTDKHQGTSINPSFAVSGILWG